MSLLTSSPSSPGGPAGPGGPCKKFVSELQGWRIMSEDIHQGDMSSAHFGWEKVFHDLLQNQLGADLGVQSFFDLEEWVN